MQAKVKVGLLATITVLLGFLRGYLFYNINWIYKTLTENRRNSAREEFYFLLEWSPTEILVLKWVLTFFFFFSFMFLTYWVIKAAFQQAVYSKIVIFVYGGIFLLSGFLFVLGYFFGLSSELYGIIRTVMGLAQSFMPLMILFILFKFFPQSEKE
ncbi:MAG: hypothetical protein WDZ35_13180 [Crocinitomicaceae bacterium]